MPEFLFEVPTNGTDSVRTRRILKETKGMYILEGCVDTHVRKATMCNRFLRWFTQEEPARAYYNTIKANSSYLTLDKA